MGNCFGGENEDDVTPLHGRGSVDRSVDAVHSQDPHNSTGDHENIEGPSGETDSGGGGGVGDGSQNQQRVQVPHQRIITEPPPPYYATADNVASGSNVSRREEEKMSEKDQLKLARRLGLLQHLPTDIFIEGGKGDIECIICMVEFEEGESIRILPCMHTYHLDCINEWLCQRSFTCPSCMEPVDSALFSSYQTGEVTDLSALCTSPGATAATAHRSSSHSSLTPSGGGEEKQNDSNDQGGTNHSFNKDEEEETEINYSQLEGHAKLEQ